MQNNHSDLPDEGNCNYPRQNGCHKISTSNVFLLFTHPIGGCVHYSFGISWEKTLKIPYVSHNSVVIVLFAQKMCSKYLGWTRVIEMSDEGNWKLWSPDEEGNWHFGTCANMKNDDGLVKKLCWLWDYLHSGLWSIGSFYSQLSHYTTYQL